MSWRQFIKGVYVVLNCHMLYCNITYTTPTISSYFGREFFTQQKAIIDTYLYEEFESKHDVRHIPWALIHMGIATHH